MSESCFLNKSLATQQVNNAAASSERGAGSEVSTGDSAQLQTLHYKDENSGMLIDHNPITDKTFYDAYKSNTDLSDFLSRPVVIYSTEWQENTLLSSTFNPWELFFTNPVIQRKLSNYHLLSCNLRLKFMINASPFYYGLAQFSYEPLPLFQGGFINSTNNSNGKYISLSQRPHVWIYPQCNQGGEMFLPFIYHKDWLDASNVVSFQEMGTVTLESYTALKNANNIANTAVTIQVIAYAEDVRVCGPTYALAAQSGSYDDLKPQSGKDEYEDDGIISKPASAIAKATGMLSDLPIIGPFMKATSNVSGKVGQVASWFGWTNVPVIDDVKPFKDLPFHSFASSEIGQPIEKLTLDPKNELTVDPRVVGLGGEDEMLISNIVMRESYITQFPWEATNAPGDTLFLMNVTPNLFDRVTLPLLPGPLYSISPTPMDHISRMFQYWRGDIVVRFRFICSKYHRGRAVILWDPLQYNGILSDPISLMPVNYNRIVDIAEEPDVEVRIPYMQTTAFRKTQVSDFERTEFNQVPFNVDPPTSSTNGQLAVFVYTAQSSPVESAEVRVMVSVRAADNFELAAPSELPVNYSQFEPQSGEVCFGSVEEIPLSGETNKQDPNSNLVYMGESVVSLRQLLRRTSFVGCTAFDSSDAGTIAHLSTLQGRYPYMYGYDPLGKLFAESIVGGANARFNWVQLHPFAYICNMYVGSRGSMNWHFNMDGSSTSKTLRASRRKEQRSNVNYSQITVQAPDSNSRVSRNIGVLATTNGAEGMSLLNQETQTGLSIQAPFYSELRMINNYPGTFTESGFFDNSSSDSILIEATIHPTVSEPPRNSVIYSYCSIGTDFNFMYFLNVPTFFTYSSVPLAP